MTMSLDANAGDAFLGEVGNAGGWLALAASPSFALMAWLTGHDPVRFTLCSSGSGVLSMAGMTTMYLLMSFFHLSHWLRLASGWRPVRGLWAHFTTH